MLDTKKLLVVALSVVCTLNLQAMDERLDPRQNANNAHRGHAMTTTSSYIDLLATALEIADIVTCDSTDVTKIKVGSACAAFANTIKFASTMMAPQYNVPPIKIIAWDLPRIIAYFAAFQASTKLFEEPTALKYIITKKGKYIFAVGLACEVVLRFFSLNSKDSFDSMQGLANALNLIRIFLRYNLIEQLKDWQKALPGTTPESAVPEQVPPVSTTSNLEQSNNQDTLELPGATNILPVDLITHEVPR